MKLFLDSANTKKIREANERYPISGVTTNPTILARENNPNLRALLTEIRDLTPFMFVQVTSEDTEGMVRDAEKIISLLGKEGTCVKIPATNEGLRAVMLLGKEGIKTTATAVYTPCQAMMFALAGAEYVAPYMSHIDNMVIDSAVTVSEIKTLFGADNISTGILGASFRTAEQIKRVLLAGADAVTLAPEMLPALVSSIQTACRNFLLQKKLSKVFGNNRITFI